MKFISNLVAAAACIGLLLPQSILAQAPLATANQAKPPVRDLALAQGGVLRGQIVNAQNVPVAGTAVAVVAGGKKVRETTTDKDGRFVVAGLKSGLYAVGSKGGFAAYRTWAPATAPPTASTAALIVESGRIERGQSPAWYWLTNPWVVSLAIAAGVAIPIAASNNKKSGS